jgi:hypothetical protein
VGLAHHPGRRGVHPPGSLPPGEKPLSTHLKAISSQGWRVRRPAPLAADASPRGTPLDERFAAIFEVVDQRIVRVDIHGSYAKALEAVGLRE